MKKTLLFVMAATALMLSVVSCSQNAGPNPGDSESGNPKILDLRNKKTDGSLTRSARDAAPEFKAELLLSESSYKLGGTVYKGEEEDFENNIFAKNIIIKENAEGFELEFTAPAGYNLKFWDLVYFDGKGNKSTGIKKDNAVTDGKLSVVYPLVKAGKTAKFWVHLYDVDDEDPDKKWETNFYYNITPVNGLGCVDDFPEGYNPSNYVYLENGHFLKIKNTIPPTARNLKHSFLLVEQDTNDIPYGSEVNGLGAVDEVATDEELDACAEERAVELSIDLTKYELDYETKGQNKPYVYAMFWWTYTLDDYDGYVFASPGICSNIIENTDFKKTE